MYIFKEHTSLEQLINYNIDRLWDICDKYFVKTELSDCGDFDSSCISRELVGWVDSLFSCYQTGSPL